MAGPSTTRLLGRRRLWAVASLALVVLVGAVAAAMAYGPLASDDADAAVLVNGVPVKTASFHFAAGIERARTPDLSMDDALTRALPVVLDQAVAHADARSRGIRVAERDVDRYVDVQRAACADGVDTECRRQIAATGLDDEAYWDAVADGFRRGWSIALLMRAVMMERDLDDGSQVAQMEAWDEYLHGELWEQAVLEWRDPDLRALYVGGPG